MSEQRLVFWLACDFNFFWKIICSLLGDALLKSFDLINPRVLVGDYFDGVYAFGPLVKVKVLLLEP